MSEPLASSYKSVLGKYAAHTKWSHTDRQAGTAAARTAFLARFERQVDPDGVLPADERARRAESALKAHMAKLSANAVKARAAKRASTSRTRPKAA